MTHLSASDHKLHYSREGERALAQFWGCPERRRNPMISAIGKIGGVIVAVDVHHHRYLSHDGMNFRYFGDFPYSIICMISRQDTLWAMDAIGNAYHSADGINWAGNWEETGILPPWLEATCER